jgi:hypothetical protein
MVNVKIKVYNYRIVPVDTMEYSWGNFEWGLWGVKCNIQSSNPTQLPGSNTCFWPTGVIIS